jgi:acylphosphatase
MSDLKRAKIIVSGLVQGVGYRYFVMRHAENLNLKGYTKNLFTGEVVTEVEGDFGMINEFIKQLKTGPVKSHVTNCLINWSDFKNEFTKFEVRY